MTKYYKNKIIFNLIKNNILSKIHILFIRMYPQNIKIMLISLKSL